ncbi:MAG: polysaccharide biosynthesis protein [Microgenomates group bacterium LiPW_31]|nr:MAG: polysaccharide biosynthesis protein [Microgenomates group bacterium LiPW_31]
MELSQKVALNTFIQIASKIITVGFALLTTILLIGYLGKEGYGDYIYIITLAIIFGSLADWGTATIGVREVAKEKENQGKLLGNIFILRLGLSFLAIVLLFAFSFFLPIQTQNPLLLRKMIKIATLIVFLVAIKASFGIIFQSRLEMQKAAVADITTSLLIFFFSWYVVRGGLGLGPLVWAVVWASGVAVVIAGILALKTTRYVFQIDKKIMVELIRESLPMGAILLMFTMDNKIDTVMLGAIKGSGAVGIYAIPYRIYDVLILGAAFLMNALLPVISQYSDLERWKDKLRQIYQKAFDILFLMGSAGLVFILIFAPLLVRFLTWQRFGEFGDSVTVLRILVLAMFIAYFNHLTGYTIVALGRQRPYFFVAFGALIFNVIANLIAIPRFSYYGAAGVTVLTEGLVLMITSIFIFRLLKIIPSPVEFPKTLVEIFKTRAKIF